MAPAVPGDLIVRTSSGRLYVLRVDERLPPHFGDDCVKQDPVYTFRTGRARGLVVSDMVEAGVVTVDWPMPDTWNVAARASEFFRQRWGAA